MKQEYRKPDLNAPRYRPRRHNVLNRTFLKELRNKYPQLRVYTDRQLKDIIFTFNTLVWETVLDYRDGIELPEQLGTIFVGSCPAKVMDNTDYKTSGELGVRVQHTNLNTDCHVGKIFYTNYAEKYKFRFHELWMFDAGREFSRAIPKVYPLNWQIYRKIDSKRKISYLYRRTLAREAERIQTEIGLETYNEFDL